MSERKNINVSPEVHDRLAKFKRAITTEYGYDFTFDEALQVALEISTVEQVIEGTEPF